MSVCMCECVYIIYIYVCVCLCISKSVGFMMGFGNIIPLCGFKKSNRCRENRMFCIDRYAYIKFLGFKVF